MRLIGHNKRFLHLMTGAPGSTHDARLLRYTTLFRQIENDGAIPNKIIDLGEAGEIPLVTLEETALFLVYHGWSKVLMKMHVIQRNDISTRNCAVQE